MQTNIIKYLFSVVSMDSIESVIVDDSTLISDSEFNEVPKSQNITILDENELKILVSTNEGK